MSIIDIQPKLDEAIDFLKHWGPEPLIFASHTDPRTGAKGAFEAKQFRAPVDWDKVRDWIAYRQKDGQWSNIYFSVNTAKGEVDKKLGRADLGAMVALHVDVDVNPGEDQAEGIDRIAGMFQKFKLPPTDIVTSGGGAQAFWRLKVPVPIDGDITIAEDLKLYNKQIERDLSGDHCHSLDHIMRVPGTVNIPNEIKLKKGRKPRLAVWHMTSENAYDLSQFEKAPADAPPVARGSGFTFDDKFATVRADDERLVKLETKWKKLGVEGDTEGKWLAVDGKTDRSRMALAFVTACKRAGVDDQTIANILMDPSWKIGECIRDKGGETKRHLKRILERGGKFVDEDLEKPPVIGRETWMKTANTFIIRRHPDLRYFNGDWYDYKVGVYVVTEEGTVHSDMRKFLNEALVVAGVDKDTGKPTFEPFNPSNTDVTEAMGALKDTVHLDRDAAEMPCWLNGDDDRPSPTECINVLNGILHVPSRKLLDHTPDFFTATQSDIRYEAMAACPVWLRVLNDYWPAVGGQRADEQSLLQEMMGYSVVPWTSLQKIFATVGPGRSGKGTIGKVLTMLVGKRNIVSPLGLGSLGRGDFSLQSFLQKTICLVGEAGFGRNDDRMAVTNILKTISGEDPVEVNRKFKDPWVGRLMTRFWLQSNQIPDFLDAGKALVARLIPLAMTIPWTDKADTHLESKLHAEAAGILNWVLEGFDRLLKNDGKFTMPESSLAMKEVFGRMASPVQNFIEDSFTVNDKCHVSEEDLYKTYEHWCETSGQRPMPRAKLIESVVAFDPSKFKRARPRLDNDGTEYKSRPHAVLGLRLKRALPVHTHNAKPDGEIPF